MTTTDSQCCDTQVPAPAKTTACLPAIIETVKAISALVESLPCNPTANMCLHNAGTMGEWIALPGAQLKHFPAEKRAAGSAFDAVDVRVGVVVLSVIFSRSKVPA